jgi:hypothetical protein
MAVDGFKDALLRLIGVVPKELDDVSDSVDQDEDRARRYVEERRESIRRGARRSGKHFRL